MALCSDLLRLVSYVQCFTVPKFHSRKPQLHCYAVEISRFFNGVLPVYHRNKVPISLVLFLQYLFMTSLAMCSLVLCVQNTFSLMQGVDRLVIAAFLPQRVANHPKSDLEQMLGYLLGSMHALPHEPCDPGPGKTGTASVPNFLLSCFDIKPYFSRLKCFLKIKYIHTPNLA